MVMSSAVLRPKSECSGKAQKQLYSNLQARPLVREGTTKLQTRNCLKEISRRKKNWSQVPDGRLTVGRKLTATATVMFLWTTPHLQCRGGPNRIRSPPALVAIAPVLMRTAGHHGTKPTSRRTATDTRRTPLCGKLPQTNGGEDECMQDICRRVRRSETKKECRETRVVRQC
jgi:hypothetical protein